MTRNIANKGRGTAGQKKTYTEADVWQWRRIKREEKLSNPKLAIRVGVSESTIQKAFEEY